MLQALVTLVLAAEAILLFRSGSRSSGALTAGFAVSTLWGAWFMWGVGRGAPAGCRVRTKRRTVLIYFVVATWLAFVGTLTALNSGTEGLLTTFAPGFGCMVFLLIASRRSRKRLASTL